MSSLSCDQTTIGIYTTQLECSVCSKKRTNDYRDTYSGYLNNLLYNAKINAQKRKVRGRLAAGYFNITINDLVELWDKQKGLCYYSHIPICTTNCSNWQASIERLDDENGYIRENIVLCCLEFNGRTKWSQMKIHQLFQLSTKENINVDFELHTKSVKKRHSHKKNMINGKEYYRCYDCNKLKERLFFNKIISEGCIECCRKYEKYNRSTPRGHMQKLIRAARLHSKRREKNNRNIDFNIDLDFIIKLFFRQLGMCAYSNVPLNFGSYYDGQWTASLERIDSLKGYTHDNVCLIALEFNTQNMKCVSKKIGNNGSGGWSHEKFEYFKQMYHQYNDSPNIPIQPKIVLKLKKELRVAVKKKIKLQLKKKTEITIKQK